MTLANTLAFFDQTPGTEMQIPVTVHSVFPAGPDPQVI